MLSTLRYYSSVFLFQAKLSIQRQLEYPLFLVSWFFLVPFQWFAGLWLLKVLVNQFQHLNGWSFEQIGFFYGLGLLSHGIVVIFFIQTWSIDYMVNSGSFDQLLVKPMNVFFNVIVSNINFIGFLDLIPGLMIFIYFANKVQFAWSFFNVFMLLLVIIGAVLIRVSVFLIFGTISFWAKKGTSVRGLILVLFEKTTMYPMSIYPYAIQILLTFVLPVGFVSFYPSAYLLDLNANMIISYQAAFFSPIVGVVCFYLAYRIFKLGLANYESAGS